MKTLKTILATILLITTATYAQLDKTNWLVGGSGSFDTYKQNETFIFTGAIENIEIDKSIKEL